MRPTILVFLASIGALVACQSAYDPAAPPPDLVDESETLRIQPSDVLRNVAYGETVDVSFAASPAGAPTYRAVRFTAAAGDKVRAQVWTIGGQLNMRAFIVREDFTVVTRQDVPSGWSAVLSATLANSGSYYAVVQTLQPSLTVKIRVDKESPTTPVTCGACGVGAECIDGLCERVSNRALTIAAQGDLTCVQTETLAVMCWGGPRADFLAIPNEWRRGSRPAGFAVTTAGVVDLPFEISGRIGALATQIASSVSHSCIITDAGDVRCMGSNLSQQLGNRAVTRSDTYLHVPTRFATATSIAVGNTHSCAVSAAGAVLCWGEDAASGGSKIYQDPQLPVPLTEPSVKIVAGNSHSCALGRSGRVTCWGNNANGQCGLAATAELPPTVVISAGATDIAAGASHSCAVVGGGVTCWGKFDDGQTGATTLTTPHVVVGLSSQVANVVAGSAHTCARRVDGLVRCFGAGSYGQLGNDLLIDSAAPVIVSGF